MEWPSFLDSFSRRHAGWLVNLEVLDPALGAQVEAAGVPLRGISVDHDHGPPALEITVGDRVRGEITHIIDRVSDMWLKAAENGSDETLEVQGRDGVVLITFRAAIRPEMVDGTVDVT